MERPFEILFDDEVQRLFDHFSLCFDIRIVFFSASGEMLRVGLNSPSMRYCRLIQEQLYGHARCQSMDETHQKRAAEERCIHCYRCHAGLQEAVKPIFVDRHLLGYVMIGQFRTGRRVPRRVLEDWEKRHGDSSELVEAFNELTLLPAARVDNLLSLFSVLVEYITSQHLITLRGNVVVKKATDYIKRNLHSPLTLDEVAGAVGRSPSSISHLFRERMGATFKQTVTELRVQEAERIMRDTLGATVKEAAYGAGFEDAAYFSRVYRRMRGEPPSSFLRRGQMDADVGSLRAASRER
jgi:AraC-like DNA-binding protein